MLVIFGRRTFTKQLHYGLQQTEQPWAFMFEERRKRLRLFIPPLLTQAPVDSPDGVINQFGFRLVCELSSGRRPAMANDRVHNWYRCSRPSRYLRRHNRHGRGVARGDHIRLLIPAWRSHLSMTRRRRHLPLRACQSLPLFGLPFKLFNARLLSLYMGVYALHVHLHIRYLFSNWL